MIVPGGYFSLLRPIVLMLSSVIYFGLHLVLVDFFAFDNGIVLSLLLLKIQYFVGLMGIILYNIFHVEFRNSGSDIRLGLIFIILFFIVSYFSIALSFALAFFIRFALSRTPNQLKIERKYLLALILFIFVYFYFYLAGISLLSPAKDFIFFASVFILLMFFSIGFSLVWVPTNLKGAKLKNLTLVIRPIFYRAALEIVIAIIPFGIISLVPALLDDEQSANVIRAISILGVSGMIIFAIESYVFTDKNDLKSYHLIFIAVSASLIVSLMTVLLTDFELLNIILMSFLALTSVIVGYSLAKHKRTYSANRQARLAIYIALFFIILLGFFWKTSPSEVSDFLLLILVNNLTIIMLLVVSSIRSVSNID
jgi:hypothetical protein